mmetsp:Transcript_13274/g.35696  ORF Transcript_13274/g.35696 Transcript_13274/m.35696 type:complete len:210 (-) Transcript_13274:550-1179(-)
MLCNKRVSHCSEKLFTRFSCDYHWHRRRVVSVHHTRSFRRKLHRDRFDTRASGRFCVHSWCAVHARLRLLVCRASRHLINLKWLPVCGGGKHACRNRARSEDERRVLSQVDHGAFETHATRSYRVPVKHRGDAAFLAIEVLQHVSAASGRRSAGEVRRRSSDCNGRSTARLRGGSKERKRHRMVRDSDCDGVHAGCGGKHCQVARRFAR